MQVALKVAWDVVAGMIPEQPDPELSRRFIMTSVDPPKRFGIAQEEARRYGESLQNLCATGRTCNWVRVDFVWM